jgi:hypothetical protein
MAERDRNQKDNAQIDTLEPVAPDALRERLNRDLAVQGTDGRPSSQESTDTATTAPVDKDGEQDGHANRRPDPARAPAD